MGKPGGPEGANIPQISGVMSGDDINRVNSHKLIDGHDYDCQRCGKTFTAPKIRRCICGARICESCEIPHDSEG